MKQDQAYNVRENSIPIKAYAKLEVLSNQE